MPLARLDDLLKQAEDLPRKDQLKLAARLMKTTHSPETSTVKWKEIRALLSHPALGEDAQAWVSRSRSASDARENQWLKK